MSFMEELPLELLIGMGIVLAYLVLMILLFIIRLTRMGIKILYFDTNGGSRIKRRKIRKGKAILVSKLVEPQKENDTFIEWCENITLTKKLENFQMPNENKKVYAKWQSDIEKENVKRELEKRTVVDVKEEPVMEKVVINNDLKKEEVINKEDFKKENKVEVVETPRKIEVVETPNKIETVKTVEPVKQSIKVEPTDNNKKVEENKKDENFQYQFRNSDPKQTYSYSKYNSEYLNDLEKKKEEQKQLENYEQLQFIARELHFSVESLRYLDEQNIKILNEKAKKAKRDREMANFSQIRAKEAAQRLQKTSEEPINKTSVNTVNNTSNASVKKEEIVNKENSYEDKYKDILPKEIVEEVVEEVDEQPLKPTNNPNVKINKDKSERINRLSENIDKLTNEIEELKNLLLKNLKK